MATTTTTTTSSTTPNNKSSGDDHELSEVHRSQGTSEIESLARRIEDRRENRLPVTWAVRNRLVNDCEKISPVRITLNELLDYRAKVQQQVDAQRENIFTSTWEWLGFRNTSKVLLELLDRATERVQEELQYDLFYYQDYAFYFTKIESKWPFLRNPLLVTLCSMLLFYVGTAVLFCPILNDTGVCPRDTPYSGWLTAMYFASTTMSTVGYGDVSVLYGSEDPEKWRVFIGAVYMMIALLVAILAFSSAVNAATEPFGQTKPVENLFDWLWPKRVWNYKHRLRRLSFIKLGAIAFQFFTLNLIGIFVARFFVRNATDPDEQWTWMETFYWSVQTTLTVGYGDLSMPFEFRWFQVFYLILSTYFVGDALGKIGSYFSDMEALRRFHAWSSREVSRGMIEDWQAEEHDDKIDQYEFAIASLLDLGIISYKDLHPIMNQFRKLAGQKGSICVEEDFGELELKSLRNLALATPSADNDEDNEEESGNNDQDGGENGRKQRQDDAADHPPLSAVNEESEHT